MSQTKIILQPAWVLHTRSYKDTSLLVDLFTLDYGKLSVIARGVRSMRSKNYGLCQPFLPLLVSYNSKNDLPVLQKIEGNGLGCSFGGRSLLCGFYLNELLVRLLHRHQAQPDIYRIYQQTLHDLANGAHVEHALRLFEKYLLQVLGFGLQLDVTVDNNLVLPNQAYKFEFGIGLSLAKSNSEYDFVGSSLLALHHNNLNTAQEFKDAKRLLRLALTSLLGNKPLKSRELFV